MPLVSIIAVSVLNSLLDNGVQCQLTSSTVSQPPTSPNGVQFLDLNYNDNLPRHRTDPYRQIYRSSPYNPYGSSIVLRRGERLNTSLRLSRTYNPTEDKLRFELSFGPQPKLDKGTLIYVPILSQEQPTSNTTNSTNDWSASITSAIGNKLNVQLDLPANMSIGIWRLAVTTKIAGERVLSTYKTSVSLFVIFNPWAENDSVHMAREDARREYVMNEIGKIYQGAYKMVYGVRWNYGQFHESVLPAVMMMLDKSRLTINDRSSPVKVSRAVSAMVNSHDDNGFLVGNWSGSYRDGVSPTQWTGSAMIFDKFLQTGGHPVKFGQCWVFGGATTTALRTLGIPARAITNILSAHDTDLSLTVDEFYADSGAKLGGINGDTTWNFHVWSDAWMARPDLPPGFGGWQAIDATPQEKSMDMYQLGPASLEAVKQGKVGFAYDVGFVYSEVNADIVRWRLDPTGSKWRRISTVTDHVGKQILTKKIGILDERRNSIKDAEDIVQQYKYSEGSKEERNSFNEAIKSAGLFPLYGSFK